MTKATVKKNFYLSKTRFVDSYSCYKKLWLFKNMPHIAAKPSLADQINMEQGTKVGVLATEVYDGVLVDNINKAVASQRTMDLLMEGTEYIFEATFIVHGFFLVQVDILRRNANGTYSIIEVKSSNSVKKNHLIDVAYQKWVAEEAGLTIESCFLKHMNKDYARGSKLDLTELFKVEEISSDIELYYESIPAKIEEMKATLAQKTEPSCDLGSQCKYPHKCPFFDHCHKEINKDSVLKFSRLSPKKRAILKENKTKYIKDVHANMNLTFRQSVQKLAATNESKMIINAGMIKNFLDSNIVFPLYHLDFEATNKAIPAFKGAKPNQFFVYQYSIDREEKNGKIKHTQYLHLKNTDPRKVVATKLVKELGKTGSIIVWNQSFEATRIKELANNLPEMREELLALVDRMVDIAVIFSRTWLYHHDMQGSASIKYVLPYICPDLSYKRLKISNGSDSQAYYSQLISGDLPKAKVAKTIKDLIAYNNLDTYAMVRVLRRVMEIVEETFNDETAEVIA